MRITISKQAVKTISRGFFQPSQTLLGYFAIFSIAAILILPALYYSLDTPFGLVDRNTSLPYKLIDKEKFDYYLDQTFIFTDPELLVWNIRFRPFLDIWNGLLWKYFGDDGFFHRLNRWLFAFGTAAFLIAAFRSTAKIAQGCGQSVSNRLQLAQVIPVAILAYIWLFFPNPSFTLIESADLYTAFFLGVGNYGAALMLTARKEGRKAHALFCLGFLGLLLSKEPAVALAGTLLVFYWCLAIVKGLSEKKIAVALALTATIPVVLWRITVALEMADAMGMYYVPTRPLLDRFSENAPIILKGLFQYEVSAAITAGFIILLLSLMVAVFAKIIRRKMDGELAFIILLLGEFASMFLALSISFAVVLRYWIVLIPLLASLLAFSAKFLLEAAKRNSAFASCTAIALIVFAGFFVSANYYNFLYQFVIQHSNRNLDDLVMSKVAFLLNQGEYVQADPPDQNREQVKKLTSDYNYLKYWPNSPYGKDSIHTVPPSNPSKAYYILDYMGKPGANGFSVHANLVARSDYGVLGCAAKVSGFLQGQTPHTTISALGGYFPLGQYHWVIHAVSNRKGA